MFRFKYPNVTELKTMLFKTKKAYHLTNKEIANALNVNEMTVSNWFNGRTGKISDIHKEAVEDYLNKIWEPALVCVWNENESRKSYFFLVGNIYDPFHTWIHNGITEEDAKFLREKEAQVALGEAVIYPIRKYVDIENAYKIGRKEESQYNLGAMGIEGEVLIMESNRTVQKITGIKYEPSRA